MVVLIDKKDCCGCGACSQICPVHCIEMISDSEGFEYPNVNEEKCLACNACKKVCPVLTKEFEIQNTSDVFPKPKALGGWIRDDEIRADSSSGGAFSLFAMYILQNGGIVYGAAMDNKLITRHIGVESVQELHLLRGSKYVQSCIGNVYSEIRDWLNQGRYVLFSGTPCQAAGLHRFLGAEKYENLYVIDFICHGVPSPGVFHSYLEFMANKYKDDIISFRFRMKDRQWNPTGLQLGTGMGMGTGKFIRHYPGFMDPYMNGFLDDVYLRESCYKCSFKQVPKYDSDITIADFWGVKAVDSELYDGKGTSLVLLNTSHGEKLFNTVEKSFWFKEVDFEMAIRRNQSIIKSAHLNPRRQNFFADYQNKPFEKVLRKYMNPFTWGSHKACGIMKRWVYKKG